jgi:thiosulfate/3-mercaptopyruvate sulfurtransferase
MTQACNTLISADALNQRLHDGNTIIIDCRFELGKPDAGRKAHQTTHIPGAVYADLERDLSAPVSATTGRHPLPEIATLSERLGSWGIDRHTQVIAYDADTGAMAAARLWWLLRWLGHAQVAVLDGGLKQWLAKGLPVTASEFTPSPRQFVAEPNHQMLVDAASDDADWQVVDARAAERYAGETEPLDPVAGHVPGAANRPFARNLTAEGRFADADTLRQQWLQLLDNARPAQVINMCGSGVTACHNVLAMEVAGLTGSKLYAGSWSEWCKDPQRPVMIGHQP